jgi:hypothetical protein
MIRRVVTVLLSVLFGVLLILKLRQKRLTLEQVDVKRKVLLVLLGKFVPTELPSD